LVRESCSVFTYVIFVSLGSYSVCANVRLVWRDSSIVILNSFCVDTSLIFVLVDLIIVCFYFLFVFRNASWICVDSSVVLLIILLGYIDFVPESCNSICVLFIIGGVPSDFCAASTDVTNVFHNTLRVGRDGHRVCQDARRLGRYAIRVIPD